ncbi:MAG: signal peptide peptidase SppA [Planctomycetota bacterium]
MRTIFGLCVAWLVLQSLGCGRATLVVGIGAGDQRLTETTVLKETKARGNQVALIDVSGMLTTAEQRGFLSAENSPVSGFTEALNKAANDDDVKAVVVRINSPGGTVTASDIMYRELLRFRSNTGKPAVASMMDLATSGGYYLACGADTVVAHPTTVTGSVGVILQTVSVKPALSKIGVEARAFTSGDNKDAGSPLSSLTEDQAETLQALVDDFYGRFTRVVRQRRPELSAEVFDQATDGRVVTGVQALEWQMVDRLGGLRDAFSEAKRLANVERADLVRYHRPLDTPGSIYAASPTTPSDGGVDVSLLRIDGAFLQQTPGAYYLWTGELP